MGQLIDDLLMFSKLSRKELVKKNISMNDIIGDVCNDFLHVGLQNKVEFRMDDVPQAYADSTSMKQVWQNLISNAIKYSQQKEKPVISIGSYSEDNKTVYYIKDNGAGFDMEYAGKLFGVFHRLHSDAEFEGTGVGLAIVKRIIDKHGGKIWADSKLNEGASFYFSLG